MRFIPDVTNRIASKYMNFQYLYVEKNMLLQKHNEVYKKAAELCTKMDQGIY